MELQYTWRSTLQINLSRVYWDCTEFKAIDTCGLPGFLASFPLERLWPVPAKNQFFNESVDYTTSSQDMYPCTMHLTAWSCFCLKVPKTASLDSIFKLSALISVNPRHPEMQVQLLNQTTVRYSEQRRNLNLSRFQPLRGSSIVIL